MALNRGLEFDQRVALGLVPGWAIERSWGHNNDCDAGTEDIWMQGGVLTWPEAAAVVSLVSTSANDAAAGTGARTVLVYGLDADYAQISELVTLNGLTPVTTTAQFLRCHRGIVVTAGSGGVNAGAITLSIGGNVQERIDPLMGQTAGIHFTVPANRTLLIRSLAIIHNGGGSSATVEAIGQIRALGGAWRTISTIHAGSGSYISEGHPTAIPEKTDLRAQAITSGNNISISYVLNGLLVTKGYEDRT